MVQSIASALVESQALYLDPAIRDWVLIPIMVVMVLVGVLRDQLTILLGGNSFKKPGLKAVRETRALQRGGILRTHGNNIPPASFNDRKTFLCGAYEKGTYLKNPDAAKTPINPMADPAGMEMMMEGMKKNITMIVPQTIIMAWVNFFFSGFVLIKLPFPLTLRFKSMLQRGVETSDMDVTWVSSLSWYFLNLFGLRSIFTLLLGEENSADGMRDMQSMAAMGGATAAAGQPQDFNKLFLAERENLELTPHEWELENVELRLLVKHGKRDKSVLIKQKNVVEATVEQEVKGAKSRKKGGKRD